VSSKHGYAAALSLVVGCGLGALTACTGGAADPSTSHTETTSTAAATTTSPPTPSKSASSPATATATTAVQIPEAARAHTKAGAEAFVKFYMDQANRAWVEPNATLLPALSDSGCLSCKSIQQTAAALVRDGQHYVSDPVTVTRVAAFGRAPKGQQYVRLLMIQHKVEVVDSTGKVVSTDPRESLARTAGVIWEGTSWRMYDIG
jgi:hypothetical protein